MADDVSGIVDEDTSKLILERLNAFGDSFLDDDYRERKKTIKKKNTNEINENGMKKKKRKVNSRTNEVTADSDNANSQKTYKLSDFDKEIEIFKQSEDLKKEEKASKRKRKKKKPKKEVEVVVFNDPSKRKKKQEEEKIVDDSRDGIMSLKKAKIDVHQFGLGGFTYEDKEKMEMQRAIRLGARPLKKEYMNYKELIKKQKEQREADAKQKEINRKLGIKVSKKPEKIVLKHKGFWVDPTQQRGVYIDGQVGKF
ncbi:uncharacterized protein C1orf131 homolog, partial [Anneissia japonica]|uniref:uncharacterized protein C1orf131 homolog n=1 Tax=Anneissia japonica TaxID=1529436 RepID=UPI001425B39D